MTDRNETTHDEADVEDETNDGERNTVHTVEVA